MHTKTDYKFDTEGEAQTFADAAKASKFPNEDKYVSGPMFMDEDVIFKHMLWASTHKKYWLVTIEIYS